jgi:hypothetical protein
VTDFDKLREEAARLYQSATADRGEQTRGFDADRLHQACEMYEAALRERDERIAALEAVAEARLAVGHLSDATAWCASIAGRHGPGGAPEPFAACDCGYDAARAALDAATAKGGG